MPKYFTENILELDPPDGDQLDRIEFLAKALAYGAVNNIWGPRFIASSWNHTDPESPSNPAVGLGPRRLWVGEYLGTWEHEDFKTRLKDYLSNKWQDKQPFASYLEALGYFEKIDEVVSPNHGLVEKYKLTPKAFSLLEKPSTAPHVFISYKRGPSSTFALLIEARLKIAGNSNVFVDKNIKPGEYWHGRLREQVEQCKEFLCLVAPGTLESTWVQKEIDWAIEMGKRVISIWHGCEIIQDIPITQTQAIQVTGESAEDYEMAVNKLLNSLGYATY